MRSRPDRRAPSSSRPHRRQHAGWRRAALCGALLAFGGGCRQGTAPGDGGPAAPGAFSAPQGIAASERYILVANTAFHYVGGKPALGAGFVTLIDRRTRRVVGQVPTSAANPQRIAVQGTRAYVVCGGRVAIDDAGLATAVTDGALDLLELDGAAPPRAPAASLRLGRSAGDPRIGAYGALALSADGRRAFIGSGTRGDVFVVDLGAWRVLHGPDDPLTLFPTAAGANGLTVPVAGGATLAVLDYNSDQLCLADDRGGDLAPRRCGAAGVQGALLEGPLDAAWLPGGELLVLMTIANGLYRVDPARDPFVVDHTFARTGLAANRVVVHGGHAYVVNSLSNNLQRVELATRRSDLPFAVLPVGSNPYDLVITAEPEGAVAWITLYGTQQVALVSLASGATLAVLPGAAAADARADGVRDAGVRDAARPCPEAGLPEVVGIDRVVSVSYGPGGGGGQEQLPQIIQGGPNGGGAGSGSTDDVLSLGVGGEIVVDFGAYDIVDGPGPDFIVYENPFLIAPYTPYAEPAIVGVSAGDATAPSFVDFPCDRQQTTGDAAAQRWPYPGCAGVRPVLASRGSCIAPSDPATAGGDAFDLAAVGLARARYLRLRDAGLAPLGSTTSKGFDLDAVVLINYKKR